MKKIGILGGMSATSSQLYYKILCELTLKELGGLHSPNILLRSVNFAPLVKLMNRGDWKSIAQVLNAEALSLQDAGAELIVLASNTMHKMAEEMMASVALPLIHIADVMAEAVLSGKCKAPAFIATKFTMEEPFYLDILKRNMLKPIVPNTMQRNIINDIIFKELCRDKVTNTAKKTYIEIVDDLKCLGADSVILGCTEVCLLLNEHNTGLPVFDTTRIHCEAALRAALTPYESIT